ncbi:hypothetical protein ACHQM5_004164 [Ranunculus cassubicifolius]
MAHAHVHPDLLWPLASLPVYHLSLFVVLCAEEIEAIRRFLWGTNDLQRKIHLIRWEELCTQFEWGGVGLRRVRDANIALLVKWLWRFSSCEDRLWRKGHSFSFWQDRWIERGLPLCEMFPNLFQAASKKTGVVSDFYTQENEGLCWDLSLRRRLTDIEIAEATKLTDILERVQLRETTDSIEWRFGTEGLTVKAVSKVILIIRTCVQRWGVHGFPWKKI